jgi:hypothetical protein
MRRVYVVMKLLNTMIVNGQEVKLEDGSGYIPVYGTKEEAEKWNGDGKYAVLVAEVPE